MKTLLVLAQHPEFPNSIRAAVNPDEHRVIHRLDVTESEPLLRSNTVDAIIIDVEGEDVRSLWTIEKLHRSAPQCPIIALAGSAGWDLAEEAYLQGVSYILPKPIRRRLLAEVLQRALKEKAPTPVALPVSRSVRPVSGTGAHDRPAGDVASLGLLRNFSGILSGSLNLDALLERSLKVLRDLLTVNRAALFLRFPGPGAAESIESASHRGFRAACSMGLPRNLLDHFELSFETGIGGRVSQTGRILRRDAPEAATDPQIQKEFELLGGQVALPIADPHMLVGIAVFDDHVTGEPLSNAELSSLFEVLEELGLAVRNVWLHKQLSANHEVLAGVLAQLGSACVVVNRDLAIVHTNKAARHYFGGRTELEFNDLPAALGSKVYQVLQTGSAIAPFKFSPPDAPATVYQVTVAPIRTPDQPDALPTSVLLLAEDRTQAEDMKRLESDASSLQQVKTIGGRLAHEINNAVMPLHLIQQELEKRMKDRDLSTVFGDSVKRIARRGAEMRALAQDSIISRQVFPLAEVVQDAFEDAERHQPGTPAKLNASIDALVTINGDREAIKLAIMEVLLNAIQANTKDPKVAVSAQNDSESGGPSVTIEVLDNGAGFSPEALQNALKPFYTTKTVGLGVGLTVADKIVSLHNGKLSIGNAAEGTGAVVRMKLPVEAARTKTRGDKLAA